MDQRQMSDALLRALLQAHGQVVNTDSDGLIAAVLLSRLRYVHAGSPMPIVGFYDNERLWASPGLSFHDVVGEPDGLLFVDADVRVPGATVVSQHVVHHPAVPGLQAPPADVLLLNPNYVDLAAGRPYRRKYPFSTAAWVWALAPEGLPRPGPSTQLLTGLLWAQDGGHESVSGRRFRDNCLEWALDLLDDMPLAPAALALRGLAADDRVGEYQRDEALVARAKSAVAEVRRRVGTPTAGFRAGWQSQQWCFAARQRRPVCDPATDQGRAAVQRFVDAVADLIGIDTAPVQEMRLLAAGTWQDVHVRDAEAGCAGAFSLARTYRDRIACTTDVKGTAGGGARFPAASSRGA